MHKGEPVKHLATSDFIKGLFYKDYFLYICIANAFLLDIVQHTNQLTCMYVLLE